MRTQKQCNKRDRRLLHAIWIAAEEAMFFASRGHNDKWQALRDALDKADDEIGDCEDFIP